MPYSAAYKPMPTTDASDTAPLIHSKKRLSPEERKQSILDGAVQYFAEVGFHGQTRELASRLGITNALLFRYFPTKEDLIEQVYHRVFVEHWQPGWEILIKDRTRDLGDRLHEFYRSYLSVAYSYTWLRIFFYASLRGISIKDRYLEMVEQKIILPICTEVRHQYGLPTPNRVTLTRTERDAVWCLHGEIIYIAIRRFIYNQPIDDPFAVADTAITLFLGGIEPFVKDAIDKAR